MLDRNTIIYDLFDNKTYESTDIINDSGSVPFVGIKVNPNTKASVFMPYGYDLIQNPNQLASDYKLLLETLDDFFNEQKQKRNKLISSINPYDNTNLFELDKLVPIKSYEVIIKYYLNHNRKYYYENNPAFKKGKRGSISWAKTIKKIKPVFFENKPIYLNYIIRKNTPDFDNLITKINKYCVIEALNWMGAKFGLSTNDSCDIIFNKELFNQVLNEKLNNTNNDEDKHLFKAMLNLINNKNEVGITSGHYGTYYFNELFEYMINVMFNKVNIIDFYTSASYNINDDKKFTFNEPKYMLKPDTITYQTNSFNKSKTYYVLDAKYYKYSFTKKYDDLPKVSDINKQITYGRMVKKKTGEIVYNAFLLPFNKNKYDTNQLKADPNKWCLNIGEAMGEWNDNLNNLSYERIQIILIDMKYLMQNYKKSSYIDCKILCDEIRNGYKKTKEAI